MIRKKNKGFSLIEVIVAVAILTLLMAPIVAQVIQTLNTSAQAKEKQYAVENAEKVLNSFKGTSLKDMSSVTTGSVIGDATVTGIQQSPDDFKCKVHVVSHYDSISAYQTAVQSFTSTNPSVVGVAIVPETGSSIADNVVYDKNAENKAGMKFDVEYAATYYRLNDEKLGRKNTFGRSVVVDNLNSQLLKSKLAVETHFTENQKATLKNAGYTINADGAAVKYDGLGRVTDIFCSEIKGLRDPNGTGVSYLQDLDSSKVAIIQGISSNYDTQAAKEFYTRNLAKLKSFASEQFLTELRDTTGSSVFETNPAFIGTVSKLTKITTRSAYKDVIDTETGAVTKTKYYVVDCVVYYENYLTNTDIGINDTTPDTLVYTAFHKEFLTNQAPDIYFVYEPYVVNRTQYVDKDYILTYDGIEYEGDERHTKLFLLKPGAGRVSSGVDEDKFVTRYNQTEEGSAKVNIYMDYLYPDVVGDLNDVVPMQVFTNINRDNFELDNSIYTGSKTGVQYGGNEDTYYGIKLSEIKTTAEDGSVNITPSSDEVYTRTNYPETYPYDGEEETKTITGIADDTFYSNKLFTITVSLDRVGDTDKGNSVKLTGAKGAE